MKTHTLSLFKRLLLAVVSLMFFIKAEAQEDCNCVSFTPDVKAKFESTMRAGKFEECHTVINQLKANKENCCLAAAKAMDAVLYNAEGKTTESYISAKSALDLLNGKYNKYAFIEANRMIGIYYNKQGKGDSAVYYYYKCLEKAEKENDYYTMAKLYSNIASVYSNQKQKLKSLEFIKKAMDVSLKSKDTSAIAQAYANLVTMYGEVYDETEKKEYLDTAIQISPTALLYAKASHQPINIIRNYLSATKFALALKDYNKALVYSDTVFMFLDEKTNPAIYNSAYIDRGAACLGLKKNKDAIDNFNKALDYTIKAKNLFMLKQIYGKLYEAYKADGSTTEALANLEKYKDLSDSLITKENTEVINEMEAKYNKLQDQQTIKDLAQQKRTYLLLAVAGLLGILAIGFFLRQQSLKHKKNILETEQRLNRARMNPHFFFNALTTLQKFALKENSGQVMASNLSKFSNIMRETLESTYKEYVTIEQEMEFLNEYLEVQKIRFPQTFTYRVTAATDLDIDELLIPAMIIQPFAENSIEHGFAGVDYPGMITVQFEKENKNLLVQITDNGKGLATTVKENNEHISRASQIIKDRIYLLNIKLKTKAGFSIDNDTSGKGVVVKINLPLLYKNQKSTVS